MKKEHDIITLTKIDLLHETERAWLFDTGRKKPDGKPEGVWVPKSQCEYDIENEELQLPEWLAVKAGLV